LLAEPSGDVQAALEAYAAHVKEKYSLEGQVSEYGVVTLKYVAMLKASISGPLARLDANRLDCWQRHWEQRPAGKRGRLAYRTCVNVIKVQQHFLRWLDRQKKMGWRIPADYERRKVKIDMTQEERAAKLGQQVKAYTVEQLAILYEYALPWERALLLLALNCAFGAREIATLQQAEIHLGTEHPHYRKLGDWIMRLRTKTDVYGEWRLWPETVAAIEHLRKLRPASKRPEVLLTKQGNTLWEPTKNGNPNRQIPNAWQRWLKRVRKDYRDFPPLGFKYLRKTAATLMRRLAGGEVASIFLAHGKATGDDLLEVYAQRPFRRVHKALRKLRRRLQPVFDKVAVPFPDEVQETRPALPLGKIRQIKEMRRQGFKVCHISKTLGVSRATVYRYQP
jgi:integrase